MVDIREVARRSGVSAATVSRALNGRPEVSEATRQRVLETARRLRYVPDQQARALVRRRSDTVGLIWDTGYVTTSGRVPFLQDLFVGLKTALAETGYHLLLLSPRSSEATVDDFVRIARQFRLPHQNEGTDSMAIPHPRGAHRAPAGRRSRRPGLALAGAVALTAATTTAGTTAVAALAPAVDATDPGPRSERHGLHARHAPSPRSRRSSPRSPRRSRTTSSARDVTPSTSCPAPTAARRTR